MKITAKEQEVAEDSQCDVICRPNFHKVKGVGIFCNGCGGDVLLVPENK